MKDTGMMFKAPLVRAILSGKKTQTRRIAKLPYTNLLGQWEPTTWGGAGGGRTRDGQEVPLHVAIGHTRTGDVVCAPTQAGDRIYVRETWCQQADDDGVLIDNAYWYRATDPDVMDSEHMEKSPWRPSIHMPRTAARIWLEVTGVRVERLHSISEADCWAEGIEEVIQDFDNASQIDMAKRLGCCIDDAKPLFAQLWESTGARWDDNPWVWVIDFKRIERAASAANGV